MANVFEIEQPRPNVFELPQPNAFETAAPTEPALDPAEVAQRLGIPGYEKSYGKLGEELPFTPTEVEASARELEQPMLQIPDEIKTRIGHALLTAFNPIFGLSQRASREVGESVGGLIESGSSPAGLATIPAATLAPGVVLPPLIKSGFEAGAQQIAEGRPIAGATTIGMAAAPALGLRVPKAQAPVEPRLIITERPPAKAGEPPPLPGAPEAPAATPPPLPTAKPAATSEPPVSPTEPLPLELESAPAAQQSLWQRLIAKNFEVETPQEVFNSSSPIDPVALETLSTAIRSAKPARAETEALRHVERAKRAQQLSDIQTTPSGKAGVGQMKGALAGELPRIDLEPLAGKLTAAQEDALFNHISGHKALEGDVYRSANLSIALENLIDHGHLPQPNQVAWFEKILGPKVASAMLGKQRGSSLRALNELANISKSLTTGFDLSAAGRQGFSLGVAHPEIASRAFQAQLRAFADRGYAHAIDRSFRLGDRARVRQESGLALPSIEGLADLSREEVYSSRIVQSLQNIKGKNLASQALITPARAYAKGLAGSERAYVTYLNWLRANVFDSVDDMLQKAELPLEDLTYQRQQLAKMINAASGRGNITSHELLNFFLFSPKFVASRFEYPLRTAKLALTNPTAVGKEARRQLMAQTATWTSLLTMLHLGSKAFDWDAEFGYDPRSSNFGKVRIGDATIDAMAGYGQAARLVARFITGKTVDPKTGVPRKAEHEREVGRFLRYKLAPLPSEAWSVIKGKDPEGKEIDWGDIPAHAAQQLLVPITAQQANEIWNEFGAAGLPLLVPEVLGFGVNIMDQDPKR